MLQHELGSFKVVDLTVWLDEVFADSMDVIDNHEFVLLLIGSCRQIYEKPIILFNIVAVLDMNHLPNHLVRHCLPIVYLSLLGRFGQKVV